MSFGFHGRTAILGLLAFLLLFGGKNLSAQRRERVGRKRSPDVVVLPRERTRVVVSGREYFYSKGVYYRSSGRAYVAIPGPVGARIRVLPAGYTVVRVGVTPFFLYYGTYYRFDAPTRQYVVVAPPAQATAPQSLDRIDFADGQSVSGMFEGGTPDSIQVTVEGTIQSYAIDRVVAIHFAPPAPPPAP